LTGVGVSILLFFMFALSAHRFFPLLLAALAGCTALSSASVEGTPGGAARPGEPRVHYTLELVPGGEPGFPLTRRPEWRLRVSGTGLPVAGGAVTLVFDSWGDWREIDSLYLDVQRCEPAVDADLFPGNALVLERPEDWDGSFEVQFAIHPIRAGSRAQERWGMLPTWSPSYSFGQTRNVFPKVYQDHGPAGGVRSVELLPPTGGSVASGWGGPTRSGQKLELDPTEGNGFIGFGNPLAEAAYELPSGRLQVVQYGKAHVVAGTIGEILRRLVVDMGRAAGQEPPDPMVVFVTDIGGGGMGADFGLVLGFTADTPDWQAESPYYHHFVAHELFHWWLGSAIRGSEAITWFHEGFTEYFSVWHLAASGVITREWFAERILELGEEALNESSWGEVAFADPAVSWRDGDGPNEVMAYKGGAMLAFALDVELRDRGEPGALLLIRELLDRDVEQVSLSLLREWFEDHDLEEFWAEYVEGTDTLEVVERLERIGYEVEEEQERVRFIDPGEELDAFFTFEVGDREE